ncbi:MarR family winged helix-turn-helix transcriptional regulator [Nocardioides sp.]|uniref:MarR family winged helix-turn-helix transcriptional regulator n=1 Tax=Nocardioides sp. TaxID=35761 RepID=UPI0035290CD2
MTEERPGAPHTAYVEDWHQTSTLLALRELLQVAQQVGPAVAKRAELGHTELAALELLVERQVGPADLARHLGVTSAASSGIVDRLVARGHVTREADASDGRRTRVVLTDSGREEVLGQLMPMFVALAQLDAGLDDAERAVVDRYLRGAIAAIRRLI